MTAHVVTLGESQSWNDSLGHTLTHMAGFLSAPPLQFFNAVQAQRDIAPQYNALTLFNDDSGSLEMYHYNQWVPFVHAAAPPAYGDTLAYNTLTALWEPSPTTNPTIDSLRIYGSSTTALEVKRVYSDTGGTHPDSTGSMDAVGVHELTGSSNVTYTITIDSSGTQEWTNATFTWTDATTTETKVPVYSGTMDGRKALAPIELSNGVNVLFTVGNYVNGETWTVTAIASSNQIDAWQVSTSPSNTNAQAIMNLGTEAVGAVGVHGGALLYANFSAASGRSVVGLSLLQDLSNNPSVGLMYSLDASPALDDLYLGTDFDITTGGEGAAVLPALWLRCGLTQPGLHILNAAAIFGEISTPSAITNKGHLYAKDKSSETIPYWRNSTAEYEIGLLGTTAAPIGADYLVGTASSGLSAEIVVGTTPGGELGGTWASPTVDTTHSGSSHAGVVSTHEAAADPHTGYVLESLLDAKGDLISASADNTPIILTVGANDTILMADSAAASGLKWVASAAPVAVGTTLATGTSDDFARASHVHVATTLVDSSGGTTRVLAASSSPHVAITGDLDVSAHGAFGAAGTVGTAQVVLAQENPTMASDAKGFYNTGTLTLSGNQTTAYYGYDNIFTNSGNFNLAGVTGYRTFAAWDTAATVTTYTGVNTFMYVGSLFGSTNAAVATTMIGHSITVAANPNTTTASQTPVGTMTGQLINVIHGATANAGQTATITTMRGLFIDVDMATSAQQRITTFTGLDIDLSGMTTGTVATGYALRIQDFGAATVTTEFGIHCNMSATPHWIDGYTHLGSLSAGTYPGTGTIPLNVYRSSPDAAVIRLISAATNDDPNAQFWQGRVATTDATVTTINTIQTVTGNMYTVEATVNGRNTGGATAGGYGRVGTFRNDAGVLTQVGATASLWTIEDTAGWDVTMAVSGTSILVRVTGAAATTITWHSHVWVSTHNT